MIAFPKTSREKASFELEEIFSDCKDKGWDCEEAEPISIATFVNASSFLRVLPLEIPSPSLAPEPDGYIAFDWDINPVRVIYVSIDSRAQLHYAAIVGDKEVHGVEKFYGRMPCKILKMIKAVLDA